MVELTEQEIRRIEGRWKSDMDKKVDDINSRLRQVERLVWIAVGGSGVIGALVLIVGNHLAGLLTR